MTPHQFKLVVSSTCLLSGAVVGCHSSAPPGQTSSRRSLLAETKPDVGISTNCSPLIFPREWHDATINVNASELPPQYSADATENVRQAIAQYPAGFFKLHPMRVYLLGSLTFGGVRALGTCNVSVQHRSAAIYLVYLSNRQPRFAASMLRRAFHHELSSVLFHLYQDRFPDVAWRSLNPPDFVYTGDGTEAVAAGRSSRAWEPQHLRDGFLSEYARASIEEDFNVIAEELWTNARLLGTVASAYPALQAKLDLVMEFYHTIDPRLDRDYFQSLITAQYHSTPASSLSSNRTVTPIATD